MEFIDNFASSTSENAFGADEEPPSIPIFINNHNQTFTLTL
jgi:hypothetical protein